LRVTAAPSESKPLPGDRSSFAADRLALIARLEDSHFWFVGRRALVERLIDRHAPVRVDAALDVGCGTGSFVRVLARRAERVVGVDPLASGTDGVIRADAEDLPLESSSFDLVVALDVLEHVDDVAAVGEIARVLKPGGVVIVSVPALPWLWSARDELAGHRRRYRRGGLVQLFEDSGLEVTETAYFQFLLLPLVALSRTIGRRRASALTREEQPPPFANRLLTRVNELEVRLGHRLPWPWGSSLAVAARKGAR
jgi:SAM-dependent methyltransferase